MARMAARAALGPLALAVRLHDAEKTRAQIGDNEIVMVFVRDWLGAFGF